MAGDRIDWEVRTTGNDSNGGGFVDGASGTDYSQQASAQVTLTTASVVGTDTTHIDVDAGDHTVAAADVGNIVNITGGTASNQGRFVIESVDVGNNRWHLSNSLGTTGQTVSGSMGGCVASLGELIAINEYANIDGGRTAGGYYEYRIWIKAGTYSLTTETPGSGGPFELSLSSVGIEVRNWVISGYNVTRGDNPLIGSGNQPVLKPSSGAAASTHCINVIGSLAAQCTIQYLKFDGNAQAANWSGVAVVGQYKSTGRIVHCEAVDFARYGLGGHQLNSHYQNCFYSVASGNGLAGYRGQRGDVFGCKFVDNDALGVDASGAGMTIANSVAANNGTHGIQCNYGIVIKNCTIINNTSTGVYIPSYDALEIVNSIIARNGTYALQVNTSYARPGSFMMNVWHYSNTSGFINETDWAYDANEVNAASSDPCPNYATDDWSPSSEMKITDSTYKSEFEEGDVYVGAVQLAATRLIINRNQQIRMS